jgi:hypothetical protein
LILGLAVLLAFGCGGDEKKEDPVPEGPIQKRCLITKQVGSDVTVDFIYNNAGKLIRANLMYPNNPANNWYQEISYNTSGNVSDIKSFENNNVEFQREVYTYNSANLPDTIFLVVNSQTAGYTKYEYDSAKKLIKRIVGGTTVNNYKEYTYPAPGQVKEILHTRSNGNLVLNTTTVNQYDNKRNPYSQLGFYSEMLLISPNNLISSTTTDHIQGTTRSFSNSLIYNAEDYPTQIIAQSSASTSHIYTYNCQ